MLCLPGFPQFASIVQGSFENLEKVRTSGVKVLMHLSVFFLRMIMSYHTNTSEDVKISLVNAVPPSLQRVCH